MKSVTNAMKVLELFSTERMQISVSEVAKELAIPKSSASRLLSAMRKSEIVAQVSKGGVYGIGPLARRLGALYSSTVSTRDIIREGMKELATETGHSCWMSVLSGTDITVVDGIHGGYPIRLVVEVGSQLPSHATAAGKALLARLEDEKIRALYRSSDLPVFTENTLTSMDRLLAELATIRKRGWAETRQEIIDGITSISVALTAASEPSGIALSVSFPVANLNEGQQSDVRHALLRTAAKLGQRIGDTNWSR
ncbi:IclR family transcriptional regulator [Mesorhizobium sp. YM1C-6-2]|uniref:IclR family transcriptional regulator n=1 Tax=Mesorhizobium sp. YM1C-6-2 TaxID=1827501 RepID=UPI000EF186CD|nr:IclR family transcriptional regulator [Mesorhizobium sp. YM1C-6-2]RLP26927.1 IclR family transcriptional regulator [Mesorhizobium sp. YM1C-6-2]